MSSAASERAASDAVGQAGNPLARSPSWPVVARSVVRSSLLRSRRRRLQLQFRRPKNGRFKRNIFGEETERRRRKMRLPVSVGGKSDDFWPGASANESCGRERETVSVVRHSVVVRSCTYKHTLAPRVTDYGGARREEGGSEREKGKLQMNRFSRRPLFLMTIPAADRGRGRGDRRRPRMSCGRGRGGKFGNVPPFSLLHINDRFGLV